VKIGALDIGTNSIHIVLAKIGEGKTFEIVGREKDMTRLGEQTFKTGWLPPEKVDRAANVIKQFVKLAHNRGVSKIIGVATSAVREASNGGEFIDRVCRETGVKVRTITGEEEARLIYLAVRDSVDLSRRKALIVDIGGGSVELIVGDQSQPCFSRCLKLGGARLSDLFISDYPVSKSDHEHIHHHIEEATRDTLREIRALDPSLMVGTSGTLLNLANILHQRRTGKPMTQVIGLTIRQDELEDLHRDLARASELDKIEGIDLERRESLLPGACLMLHLMDELKLKEFTLCDRAIREGMILDYIARNSKKIEEEREIPNVRRRSVLALAGRCEYEALHAGHTAELAIKLFRALDFRKELHPNAEELLEYGALLHDIGYHVSYRKHHKHAYYLIKNADMNGFSPEEVDIIACIARYHRKAAPRRKDLPLRGLSSRDVRTVKTLSAIVRVVDALDRSHFAVVRDLRVQRRNGAMRIHVVSDSDPAIELWSAEQRKRLLEKVCKSQIRFEAQSRPS
jgi:exopolyphosphatase/guanosine-5'-triphosphate,3'-diphosphate pyrophosphatase